MLNGGWSIGTELIYQRRSGVKADQHHMARTYHFSSTMEYVRIDAKKLHYLELPVLARYTMKQHIVHAGVGFVYLVDCESEVTHSKWDYENSQTEVTVENGHVSGFNRWDIALMAGYEYEPLQWISIGGRVSYGFIDVTKPAISVTIISATTCNSGYSPELHHSDFNGYNKQIPSFFLPCFLSSSVVKELLLRSIPNHRFLKWKVYWKESLSN